MVDNVLAHAMQKKKCRGKYIPTDFLRSSGQYPVKKRRIFSMERVVSFKKHQKQNDLLN